MRWLSLTVLGVRIALGVGRRRAMPRGYRSEPQDETFSIDDVYVKHGTEKALLCVINGDEHWIPKSQIDDASEVFDDLENDEGTLVISEWLAKQKGLL